MGRVVRSGVSGDRVPQMTSRGRSMRITHCERFGSVSVAGTPLEVRSYPVNPGVSTVFPWLADVANRFEKYKFSSVRFRYVPQSAALAGLVTLAFDFDPNDDAPITMSQATTYHDYVSTSIWQEATLQLDLANGDRLPQKNTRPGLPGADLDLNVYDVGNLYVLTEGAATGVLGYLEVIYTVDLFIHQIQNTVSGKGSATAGLASGSFVGTNFTADAQAYLPVEALDVSTLKFVQPFEGLVTLYVVGTGLTGTTFFTVGSTCTVGPLNAIPKSDGTVWLAQGIVRALPGDLLVCSNVATTATSASWRFARGDYAALN